MAFTEHNVLRFLYAVGCFNSPSLFIVENIPYFVYSPTSWWTFDCPHILSPINNVPMNIHVQVFEWTKTLFIFIRRRKWWENGRSVKAWTAGCDDTSLKWGRPEEEQLWWERWPQFGASACETGVGMPSGQVGTWAWKPASSECLSKASLGAAVSCLIYFLVTLALRYINWPKKKFIKTLHRMLTLVCIIIIITSFCSTFPFFKLW